jgi:membrane associated rhomboid family serine protease
MNTLGIFSLVIIVANVFISYKGFKDSSFFEKYKFEVEKILLYKQYIRLISSGFLHVNWMHLIFNMIALYFFAGSVEAYLGQFAFLLIYFASLIGGNLLSLFIHRRHPDYTSVGASGAVNGILFGAIAMNPNMHIGLFFIPIGIPAWIFGLIYVLISIYGIRSRNRNIGHEAHLGGALIGMIIAILLRPTALIQNPLPILLVALPAIGFIYFIITRPNALLIDNHYYNKHKYYNIDHRYNDEKVNEQKEIDAILEKIHKRGMGSLTQKEKNKLKQFSKSK